MNLYNIKSQYLQIAQELTDGECTPELEQALIITQENLQEKAINYGYVIKNFESEVDIIEEEIKRLNALKKARINAVDKLKNNISDAMKLFQILEVKAPTFKMNFRTSESVEIFEGLDNEFITEKVSYQPDKIAIKNAIKEGREVNGAALVTNFNLQIK
jgi:hypothetical protein